MNIIAHLSPEEQKIINSLVSINYRKGNVFATSREIAKRFGKNHFDVLRAIENILNDGSEDIEFNERNFALCFYQAKREGVSKKYKEYHLTRQGAMLIIMGFTGKEALKWKKLFIYAFDLMLEQLQNREASRIQHKPLMDAIKEMYKPAKGEYWCYAQENDMLNEIATGLKAWQIKQRSGEAITKQGLFPEEMERLLKLQVHDETLVKIGFSFERRKAELIKISI